MGEKSIYYGDLAEYDVQKAYAEIGPEIIESQDNLRNVSPEHTLLDLISVDIPGDLISFSPEFGDDISKWTGIPRKEIGNWYYGMGHYIEQMNSETEKLGIAQ